MSSDCLGLPNKEECKIVDFDFQFERLHLLSTAHANCVYMRRCLREWREAAQGAPYVVTTARQLGSSGQRGRVCRRIRQGPHLTLKTLKTLKTFNSKLAGEGVSAHQTYLSLFFWLACALSFYAKEYRCDCGVADMSDQEEVVEEDVKGGVGGGSGEKEEGGGGAERLPQEQDLPAE